MFDSYDAASKPVSRKDLEAYREFAFRQLEAADNGHGIAAGKGLYPYLWGWDTFFIAKWVAKSRPDLSLKNTKALFKGQWENGLLPQIVFFEWRKGDYFPQPDYWGTAHRKIPTSSIIQPPVAALAVWELFRHHGNNSAYRDEIKLLLPQLEKWHDFLARERDPLGLNLLSIFHPWASGMDNAPQWELPLRNVDGKLASPFQRVDLSHVKDGNRQILRFC